LGKILRQIIGNLFETPIKELAEKRYEIVKSISNGMSEKSPNYCLTCKHRLGFICEFDKRISIKANELI